MNAEVKKKWIEALRSDDYKQAKRLLRKRYSEGGMTCFCAYGVLVDLYCAEHNTSWEDVQLNFMCNLKPSMAVLRWAGIDPDGLELPLPPRLLADMPDKPYSVYELNDDHNVTFLELADLIEKHA